MSGSAKRCSGCRRNNANQKNIAAAHSDQNTMKKQPRREHHHHQPNHRPAGVLLLLGKVDLEGSPLNVLMGAFQAQDITRCTLRDVKGLRCRPNQLLLVQADSPPPLPVWQDLSGYKHAVVFGCPRMADLPFVRQNKARAVQWTGPKSVGDIVLAASNGPCH